MSPSADVFCQANRRAELDGYPALGTVDTVRRLLVAFGHPDNK
jgi:hypothetical protein